MVEPGAEPVFNSHFLMGACLLTIQLKISKIEGASVFNRGDQADSIPFYRGQFMKEGLLIKIV